MKLSKQIPARTKTLYADWCTKEWCAMNDVVRDIRKKARNKFDKCYWCKYKFKNGDIIALAGFTKDNQVLCTNCAEELINEEVS